MYDKHENSSPALSQDGFLGSLTIDAHENRHIAIADIAGAFLKANQDDYVLVKLTGPVVEALLQINEKKYKKFLVHEKIQKLFMLGCWRPYMGL